MNEHHLKLFKELSKNSTLSRRDLSNIRDMYILTPEGIKGKVELTFHFLQIKIGEYDTLRMEI